MDRSRRNAFVITLLILACAPVVVMLMGPAQVEPDAAVVLALPEHIGAFQGDDVLICQSDQCSRSYRSEQLDNKEACPRCGAPLGLMAPAERQNLPEDTVVLRKRYAEGTAGAAFVVSVVLSGKERRSIHKPQVCLVAQGCAITDERVLVVPLGGGRTLEAMCLRTSPAGAPAHRGSDLYAYWFVARERETPYHWQRLLWTAWDGVVHGRHRRWAYLAVEAPGGGDSPSRLEALRRFMAELHPLVVQ